jgi:hypothetical protein
MSNYYNRQWRLPNNENKDKQSNYSMDFTVLQTVEIPSTSSFDFGTGNFSISWWMKKGSPPSQTFIPLINIGSYGQTNGFIIYLNGITNVFTLYRTGQLVANSTITISNSIWNFCTLVRDGANATLYIKNSNGDYSEVLSTSIGSTNFGNSTSPSFIGGNNSSGSKYWDGQLDAVAIFNYALSSSQVTTLYGSSSTGIGNPMSLSPKPVAYYPLGDQDAFNGANYLVPNSSLKDYVFDFDGSDYIDCGSSSNLELQTISVSFWIKETQSASSLVGVVAKNIGSNIGWMIWVDANQLIWQVGDGSTNASFTYSKVSNFRSYAYLNQWNNICCTFDGTDAKIYINNVLHNVWTPSSPFSIDYTNIGNLNIGKRADSTSPKLNASLSNVSIFNSTLTASQVSTLYNGGTPETAISFSPVSWWKLDASATYDSSTTTWTIPDDSSNSNDGTSSGMTQANLVQSDLSFTSGYSPYALDFDGTDDLIDLGRPSSLNLMPSVDEFSISAWFKTTSSGTIYSFGAPSSSSNTQIKIVIRGASGTDDYYPEVTLKGTATTIGSSAYNDGNWHNIILTCTTSTAILYIDGSNVGSPTIGTATITSTDNGAIGARTAPTGGFFFNGSISNVSIWNAGLTSSQVTEIYNEGVPSNLNNHSAYSNLISWWQLGSNSSFNTNWTVLDEKGSNNGTSANMTEADIVDGVGSSANGLSSGMGGDEIVGNAFGSSANALSVNMDIADRTTDVPS